MKYTTNVYQYTLKTYYQIIKVYMCGPAGIYSTSASNTKEDFLEYCYEVACDEFDDGQEYHSANEYQSPEALTIIYAAEKMEESVQDELSDDEWNDILELSYNRKAVQ